MKRPVFLGLLALAVIIAGTLSWVLFPPNETRRASAPPAVGGPFTLVDHTGRTVTDADFRGRYLLIFFGYTYCPDVCPTSLQTIREAMDLLDDDGKSVQPVFVSVDPGRDAPEVLKLYVEMFGRRIMGLTGTEQQIASAAKAYGVYYARVSEDGGKNGKGDSYLMNHSAITYLMGPGGEFLTHFSHGTKAGEMAERIRAFVKKSAM